MTHRIEILQVLSPGKPVHLSPRSPPPPLASLVPRHPVVSLETSGAYRLSPTKKLVRLPMTSPRESYREDIDGMHFASPIRDKNEIRRSHALHSLLADSMANDRTRASETSFSPESVRKRLHFDIDDSLQAESSYSEHITSRLSEAKNLLASLRTRRGGGAEGREKNAEKLKDCLEDLRTATNALDQIGEVLKNTAGMLATSAKYLDGTVSRLSEPNYYRRHEYPHSHRLLPSPY